MQASQFLDFKGQESDKPASLFRFTRQCPLKGMEVLVEVRELPFDIKRQQKRVSSILEALNKQKDQDAYKKKNPDCLFFLCIAVW